MELVRLCIREKPSASRLEELDVHRGVSCQTQENLKVLLRVLDSVQTDGGNFQACPGIQKPLLLTAARQLRLIRPEAVCFARMFRSTLQRMGDRVLRTRQKPPEYQSQRRRRREENRSTLTHSFGSKIYQGIGYPGRTHYGYSGPKRPEMSPRLRERLLDFGALKMLE